MTFVQVEKLSSFYFSSQFHLWSKYINDILIHIHTHIYYINFIYIYNIHKSFFFVFILCIYLLWLAISFLAKVFIYLMKVIYLLSIYYFFNFRCDCWCECSDAFTVRRNECTVDQIWDGRWWFYNVRDLIHCILDVLVSSFP